VSQSIPPEPDSELISSEPESRIQQNSDSSTMKGGMQSAIGNNNNQSQNTYNQWLQIGSRDKVLENRINELQKDFREFQQRYDSLLKILDDYRELILATLEDSPSEKNKLDLTYKLGKIIEYQADFKSADKILESAQEASKWLSEKREKLVLEVRDDVIKYYKNRKNKAKPLIFSSQQIEQFCKDIDNYLFWIGNEMALGKEADKLPINFISSSLSKDIYLIAFKFLVNHRLVSIPELDDEAIKSLKAYICKFIIKPLKSG
jgi:hypothetical protein